jgi:hypothetical protein
LRLAEDCEPGEGGEEFEEGPGEGDADECTVEEVKGEGNAAEEDEDGV